MDRIRQPLKLIQLTDTHIFPKTGQLFNGVDTAGTLKRTIEAVRAESVPADAVVVTGDVVHEPDEASYLRFRSLLNGITVPVYCLPGNHDDPELMAALLNERHISTQKSIETVFWQIILLNTCERDSDAGSLSDQELDWLQAELERSGNKFILICLHHHPVRIESPWMDAMMLKNGDKLFTHIRGYPVKGIVWGHIHQEYHASHEGVKLMGSASTCIQFVPRATAFGQNALPPAYREINLLADGTIDTYTHYLR